MNIKDLSTEILRKLKIFTAVVNRKKGVTGKERKATKKYRMSM